MTRSARLAWPKDAAAIARVQRDVWTEAALDAETFGPADEHVDRWAATVGRSPDARFRVLVATDDADLVIGYAVVHPGADPDVNPADDAELGEFAIAPAARRAGHGSRLLHAVVDTAAADRFTVLRAWLSSVDDATRALLTASGWAADGAHRELAGPDDRRIKQVRLHTRIA